MTFRTAVPSEAPYLTELAMRSKAHWGYPPDFLDACRAELTFDPATLDATVLEVDGRIVGFYAVSPSAELSDLWVEPSDIGRGYGRRLWTDAVAAARAAGFDALTVHADPYAEGFYLAMGAERVGEIPSGSLPGRVLPLLRYTLP